MDFFPSVFSQKDLFWLDNLMPASNKKTKDKKKTKKEKKSLKTGPTENEVDNTTFLLLDIVIYNNPKKLGTGASQRQRQCLGERDEDQKIYSNMKIPTT